MNPSAATGCSDKGAFGCTATEMIPTIEMMVGIISVAVHWLRLDKRNSVISIAESAK